MNILAENECTVVTTSGTSYIVNLNQKTCSCGVWKDTEIPCSHAIAFLAKKGLSEKDFLTPLFTVQSLQAFYLKGIPAIDFESLECGECSAPPALRQRGRPQTSRIPSNGEEGVQSQSRHCGRCQSSEHNRRKCPLNSYYE